MNASPVESVEVLVLRARAPRGTDLDASAETVVVCVTDADGRTGIGEADAPGDAVRVLVSMHDGHAWSRGLANVIVGKDPFELRARWAELYGETIYHGRRGLGIHALSAVDVALHDLVGKQLGRPVYQLLGGARHRAVRPYATIYAGPVAGRTIGAVMDDVAARFERALALGFRAVKFEVLFEDLVGDRDLEDCIREGRRLLGDDVALLLDFGYRWRDWRDAARLLERVDDCDVWLAEAALRHDDLDGHRRLAARVGTRIGGAELAATVHECREWLERGGVDVLQPDVNRAGGLTELVRICDLADLHGAQVVPHCWKTGITAAAARHLQLATANVPFVETLHPELYDSPLRSELVRPEPVVVDGLIEPPDSPGLGVELDAEAVGRYAVPPE